ncbi:MAG: SDR family oxidoreductase [Pseudomonadota bacterium]
MPTVLVTGANRGIGLELARQYLADGWQVIALGRTAGTALASLPAQDRLRVLTCSLVDDAALAATLSTLDKLPIDVLINNAGAMNDKPFGEFDRDAWRSLFEINVYTPQSLTELLIDNVLASEQRKVLIVSSVLGSLAMNRSGGLYAYRASKAAANAIAKSMAVDLGSRGVLVAALHPGWVRTDMGSDAASLSVDESVTGLRRVIDRLDDGQAGQLIAYDGKVLPW